MKYFEVNEPYYALLKAESQEKGIKEYINHVADDDGTLSSEIKEVDRDYTLVNFSQALSEEGDFIPVNEVLELFNNEKVNVLVIDGSLV